MRILPRRPGRSVPGRRPAQAADDTGLATHARLAVREHLAPCCVPSTFRRCLTTALVVGTTLTAVNQGSELADGRFDSLAGARIALNFLIPFIVSNVGVLSRPAVPARPERR